MKKPATAVTTAKTPTLAAVVRRVSLLIRTSGPWRRLHPNTTRQTFAVTLALVAGCGPGRAPSAPVPAPAATQKPSGAVASNITGWQTATGSPEPVSPDARAMDGLLGEGCR